jgi:hypothetical protein
MTVTLLYYYYQTRRSLQHLSEKTITCIQHIEILDSFDDEMELTVLLLLHMIFSHL